MRQVVQTVARAAAMSDATVLILGESGTGKNVVAQALHNHSSRKGKPFQTITCTALPETLLESELFGHEKGAFTDARELKPGLLEMANTGTVFLDEIGDMPEPTQAKLLRFLENKSFRRLGGLQDIQVDVRVVAATHRDLEQLVAEGRFRQDLYYRLQVLIIRIPPLRERPEDVPMLTRHFLELLGVHLRGPDAPKDIGAEALSVLTSHTWPGNIRELRNVIERAVILAQGKVLVPADIELSVKASRSAQPDAARGFRLPAEGLDLEALEKDLLRQALERAGGNRSRAGRLLGLSRDQIRYRIEKYGM